MLKPPNLFVMLALPAALHAQNAADARWLAECRGHDDGWRAKSCEVRITSLPKGGIIRVDPGRNGGAAVEGWDRDTIEVHARIQAAGATEDEAAGLARAIKITTSGTTIGTDGPAGGRDRSWSVSFVVYAPRHSDLKLDTYSGPIDVRDVTGRMALTAHNGPITLTGVGGDVRARTTNGPLDVELTGARWDGEGLDAETINGPLDLAIPENYSAQLDFGTVNGPMNLSFPLKVTVLTQKKRRFSTTLGAGGALVRAVTTNGPVDIRRN